MSLYFEASKFISNPNKQKGTLKSRVFADKTLKSKPAQIYGLAIEASKYAHVLKEVIDNSKLLSQEKKLTPELALLLVHDLLLSKRGVAAPQGHKLRQAVEKHKTRLHAELTKYRLRHKFATIDDLKASVSADGNSSVVAPDGKDAQSNGSLVRLQHPRWVRINRLKTTSTKQDAALFSGYVSVEILEEILSIPKSAKGVRKLYRDANVNDLVALPAGIDLSRSEAYLSGEIILQDKASCFPASFLCPDDQDDIIIDACAAPGNKTTHLAALVSLCSESAFSDRRIIACERDKGRAEILRKMVKIAGGGDLVTIEAGQDFLKTDPQSEPWCRATSILLDPSCSGSGIIGRDEAPEKIVLPSVPETNPLRPQKRKRGSLRTAAPEQPEVDEAEEEEMQETVSKERLESLARFQAKMVQHAFTFPRARKVVYSTCSIHEEENENVVATVLASGAAKTSGWRIMKREEQVHGMKRWHKRGVMGDSHSSNFTAEMAEACIRCEKHTTDGTQGFFVAGFVSERYHEDREHGHREKVEDDDSEEEWEGFEDD